LIAALPIAWVGASPLGMPFASLVLSASTIAFMWFMLATCVKRWHDLGQSGWMVLLNFTFVFIPVALVWLGFIKGKKGNNRYGLDPA
jgi:uncharacterized membrane protein YhaH (DUF805 family)